MISFFSFLILFGITLLPIFELRLGLPLGVLIMGLPLWIVIPIVLLANILAGIIGYFLIDAILFVATKIPFVKQIYDHYVKKAQNKIHPLIEKWGVLGLALFIGIPLPLSGAYTGSFGAKILGMDFKEFLFGLIVGVIISCCIVLVVTLFLREFLFVIGFNEHTIALFQDFFTITPR